MRENASPAVETGVGAGFADTSRAADLAAGLHTPVLLGRCLDLLAPALEEAVAQAFDTLMADSDRLPANDRWWKLMQREGRVHLELY